jgi:hypothetical protein
MNIHSSISRRNFITTTLRGAAAIGACAGMESFNLFAAQSAATTTSKLRFGFTSYQWGKDWDIPTLIANLQKAEVFGMELRTSASYAHGVELSMTSKQRTEVKKRFADSPIKLVGIASAERMDWPEPEKLKAAIEAAKAHVKLSYDTGASGVRIFPNDWHPNVPHEKTIEQIAKAVDQVGAYAADFGQEVRLEAHGSVGELTTLRAIMDIVAQRSVRIKLNSDARDTKGKGFEANFSLVKNFLGHTIHLHELNDTKFPYQLQIELLKKINWEGWCLLEASASVPDRLQALIEQRKIWDSLMG